MVSKTEKFRGSRTHGRGKKAGRGAGLRGGRGNAGLHKHKYIWTVKYDPDHFGRHGFKRHPSLIKKRTTVNVSQVEINLHKYLEEKTAFKKGDVIEVDLRAMKIDKLLGAGKVTTAMKITVSEASKKALDKIKKAGGEVIISKTEKKTEKSEKTGKN